ncbi:MAG: dihydrodipicolinate synthase family protein [Lachnospiraceae bacterium]|jgi:4-hydroxy-tetrahydrodipicolinate synthase|nr:dihydrodipicolinate synthase family protein [Lachnospiraceae bacterium]
MEINYYTPVVTAFDENGVLDIEGNKHIYDYLINGGIKGFLILGSSGEFYTMTLEERKALIDMAIPYINKRAKVFIGSACSTVEETIELSNYALKAGADGVMVISPYYFEVNDATVEGFFDEVAEKVDGPIYIYNFPARTGYDVKSDVILNLLRKHKNIVGIKDSVPTMGHTREIIVKTKKEFPDFEVYCGFDENLVHNGLCGGNGSIGALSNIYPEMVTKWAKAVENKDWETSAYIQNKVDILMGLYDINPFFIPLLKKAMILKGVEITDCCKKPALKVTEEETAKLKAIMEKAESI